MLIRCFKEPPLDNNNYVVIDEATHEAALIDCSHPDEGIMDFIRSQGATLKFILLTHGHLDHVMGVMHFRKQYRVPVFIHAADKPLLAEINDWTARLGLAPVDVPVADKTVDENTVLMLGNQRLQVLETPGHTPGGVCYLAGMDLFSGDTLFLGTHGRTDLPRSSPQQMVASLKRLMQLPVQTRVWPGHGADTTIGAEQEQIL